MVAFNQTCFAESPHPLIDIDKWQQTIDLLSSLYTSKAAVIVQYLDDNFRVVAANNATDGIMSKHDCWSAKTKSFCRAIMETDKELYVSHAVDDKRWSDIDSVKNGPVRSYLGYPIYWPDGQLFGTICIIDDKQSAYSEAFQQLLGQFRDLIAKDLQLVENYERIFSLAINVAVESDLPDVLALLTRSIEVTSLDSGLKCSILLIEDGKYLRNGASPSLPKHYVEAINGIEIGPDVGSCGAAAFHKKPVIIENIRTHPNWAPYLELVEQTDLYACWSEPIMSASGDMLGTFALYFDKPKSPSQRHIELIQTCVFNARLAIEHHRMISALQEARQEAESANRTKSQFLGNMSHELRTPLNAIIGFASVKEQQALGPIENTKYQQYATDIAESGRYLLSLIDDILEFTRIEADNVAVSPELIEINPVITDCVRILELHAAQRSMKVINDIKDDTLSVYMDKRHLKQVLINLITNAIKYAHPNGTVKIASCLLHDSVEISIIDNGPGIPAHQIHNVFTPFHQVIDSHKASQDGFGLGLPLSKNLMELNGGSLHLDSEENIGTTARIHAPKSCASLYQAAE